MVNFPATLDTTGAGTLRSNHTDNTNEVISAAFVNDHSLAIVAVETKVGSGSSTPLIGQILSSDGTGTSVWETFAGPPLAVTAVGPTAITAVQEYVRINAASNAVTVTLPDVTTLTPGMVWFLKRIDSVTANAVTVNPFSAGQTIDGATTVSLPLQYDSLILVAQGAVWDVF